MSAEQVWESCARAKAHKYGYLWSSLDAVREAFADFHEVWDAERELAGDYDATVKAYSECMPDRPIVYEYMRHVVPMRDAAEIRFVTRIEQIDAAQLLALHAYCPCARCESNPLFLRECACCVGCLRSERPHASLLEGARDNLRAGRKTNGITRLHVEEASLYVFMAAAVLGVIALL